MYRIENIFEYKPQYSVFESYLSSNHYLKLEILDQLFLFMRCSRPGVHVNGHKMKNIVLCARLL